MQHYETTLEEMAAASLDSNFKEELTAIEQWFRVLSEAERTAALYSLLQSATPLQMRFFITVLQQMARQDPAASALLTPANPSQRGPSLHSFRHLSRCSRALTPTSTIQPRSSPRWTASDLSA